MALSDYDKALRDFLRPMVNSNRLDLLEKVMELRTRYITVVLEDIYQPHNASAVLRTCDCFGIQDVHIIENKNKYDTNPDVELGAAQWLTLHTYNKEKNNTSEAINKLKKLDYRIIATTPHRDSCTPDEFDLHSGKVALLFGTELQGLSKHALDLADEYVKIPMAGFTESFNISVSAAILLYQLDLKLKTSDISWGLDSGEKEKLRLDWIRNSVNNSEKIENAFKKKFDG